MRGVGRRPGDRAVYSLVVAAAVGVLPGWARRELGLSVPAPVDFLVDTIAVTPMMRVLSDVVRWVVPPPACRRRPQVARESPPSMTTTWPVT